MNHDSDYQIRDIYYPFAGKENHTGGHAFRFGVWADGRMGWMDRKWQLRLEYLPETLITNVLGINEEFGVAFRSQDVVDYRENVFLRRIDLTNTREVERDLRLFLHHDFYILESPTGDTAYYDPDEKAIIHYKANRFFLMSGIRQNVHGIDQYATGVKEFRGFEGTWRDAEDGLLQGNPIAQGSVDSTLSFFLRVAPGGTETIYYWIAAGRDYAEVSKLNKMIQGHGPEHFFKRTKRYWQAWVNKEEFDLSALPDSVRDLYKKSLLILRTNIDAGGAIIAGNDADIQFFARDTYSYMWPRDGAFTAYALDLAGYIGPTARFFDFCLDIINEGKESSGYFLHKYHPDGCLGSSWHPWMKDKRQLPIQEDSTALVLWALWFHFDKYRDIEFAARQYESLVIRCGDFLASYRDDTTGLPLPSYDMWEEEWGVHTFTVSAVYGGLRAAERFAVLFGDTKRATIYGKAAQSIREAMARFLYSEDLGRFLKRIVPVAGGAPQEDTTVDAGLYAPCYFGVFEPNDERVVKTMETLRDRLWIKTEVGGLARYEGDIYFRDGEEGGSIPGNPWPVCTLWLAQWHVARAQGPEDLGEALRLIEWVAGKALPSGVLAEQIDPHTGKPLSVSPLTWSHATFVATVLEYLHKLEGVERCPACGKPVKSHSHK